MLAVSVVLNVKFKHSLADVTFRIIHSISSMVIMFVFIGKFVPDPTSVSRTARHGIRCFLMYA